MKVITPEISWHERDPIYSVDCQPGVWSVQRIASGGGDKIVRIWQLTLDADGKGQVDFLSNLRRHTASVNVVRFSRNGELLATAGDDSTIILWKLNDVPAPPNNIFSDDDAEEDKESWVCHKTLRGHLGDVVDLSWSKDNSYLVSGSVDNCAILWDVTKAVKLSLFKEHKSYVQGVAFDPLGTYIATLSADRSLRLYNFNSKNCVHNISKMTLPSIPTNSSQNPPETKPKPFRIFHDDSLRSFFRRLEFSPDGQLLIAPAGCMELGDNKLINASFIFVRGAFSKPAVYLPSPDKTTTVVKVNPQLFELRPADGQARTIAEESEIDHTKAWDKSKSLFCLPYRIVYAVGTEDSVLIYDTQQTMPIGLLKNIHYLQISDLSWTGDGRALIISSTDGFCTIATFEDNELGVPYKEPCTDGSKLQLTPTMKGQSNGETDKKSPETGITNSQHLEEKTPKRPKNTELKIRRASTPKGITTSGNITEETITKPSQQSADTGSITEETTTKPSQQSADIGSITEETTTKPSQQSADTGSIKKETTTKPSQQSADTVTNTQDTLVVPGQPELSDQINSISLQGDINMKVDNVNELTEAGSIELQGTQRKEKEDTNKDCPKKKRVQITTLSLFNKK